MTFPRPETWRWTKWTTIGCLTCRSNGLMGGPWPMKAEIYSRPSAVSLKVWLRETRGSVPCSRAPQSWYYWGWRERCTFTPPPTIPAGPRLELATFGLRVRLSNHKATTSPKNYFNFVRNHNNMIYYGIICSFVVQETFFSGVFKFKRTAFIWNKVFCNIVNAFNFWSI